MQFDVFRHRRGGPYPLLLDVQVDLFEKLPTRVTVPMALAARYGARLHPRLNPYATLEHTEYVLLFHELAATPLTAFGPCVGSLAHRRDDLVAAIDLLVTGV